MNNERLTPKNCVKYAFNRVRKIYWLYIVTMLFALPVSIHSDFCSGDSLISILLKNGLKIVVMPTLLQSATGMQVFSHMLNGVGWYLSTAFILYMFYPFLEKWIARISSKKPELWLCLSIVCTAFIRFLFRIIETKTGFFNDLSYGFPVFRVFDLITGILLCDTFTKSKDKSLHRINTFTEMVTLSLTVCAWLFITGMSVLSDVLSRIVIVLVIYVFAYENGKVSRFFSSKPMVYLGGISMYIYLIHDCVRMNAQYWLRLMMTNNQIVYGLTIIFTIAVTAVAAVAVEKLNAYLKRRQQG